MADSRWVRKLLIRAGVPLGVLAILVLAAWLTIGWFTSPERLVRLLREQLVATCGGDVRVGGAEAHLLSGIVFHDIELRETPDAEPWASVRELRLNHRPAALLLGEFIIDAVVVVEPRLVVSKASLARLSRPGGKAEGRFPHDIVMEQGWLRIERDAGLPALDGLEVGPLSAHLVSPDPRGRLIRFDGRFQLPAGQLPFGAPFEGALDLGADPPSLSLHVRADGLPVDEKLPVGLPEMTRRSLADAGLTGGLVDVEISFQAAGEQASLVAGIDLHGCSAKPAAFPYPIDDLSGKVHWTSRTLALTLESVTGKHGTAALTINGRIGLADPSQPRLQLAVRAMDLIPDDALLAALPDKTRRALAPYAISGPLDLRLALTDDGKAPARIRLSATARGAAANATPDGPRLTDLYGDLGCDGQSLTLTAIRGRLAVAAVEMDGTVGWGPTRARTALRIRVPSVEIRPSAIKELPGPVAAEIQRLGASGTVGGRAFLRWREGESLPYLASAFLTFDSLALKTEPAVDHLSGSVAYDGLLEAGSSWTGSIAVTLSQARVAGIPVQLATARGTLRPTSLTLSDVNGTVCGGRVAGQVEIKSFQPLVYGGQIEMAYVDVESLASALGAGKDAPSGWLRGSFALQGKGPDLAGINLCGKGKVDRGHLYDLPLIVRIWNLYRLDMPNKGALTEARVEIQIRDSALTFVHFLVTGQSLPMDIKGRISLDPGVGFGDQKIDLLFTIAKERGLLDNIPILSWVKQQSYDRLARQFLQVRATGTLGKPQVEFLPKLLVAPINEFWDLLRSVADEAAAAGGLK